MQRLTDMSTSELIQTAIQYSASIKEIGIYSELVKELTTRLGANTAAVTQALKERDEAREQVVNLAVENAALTSGCGFFAYDPDNGFEEFKTKDEAIEAAESYIDYYRGDACDGWADEVSQVSWGVVMQQSTKVDERPKNAEDSVSDYIETVCDFALLPAIISPTTDAAIASIQAQGVDKFAANEREWAAHWEKHGVTDGSVSRCLMVAQDADKFSAQLRKEAGNA